MPCSCSCTPFNKLSIHSMKFMFYTLYKDINCFMPIHSIDLILHTLFWWPEEKHVILTQRHYIIRSIKMKCIVSQNIIILHWCAICLIHRLQFRLMNWNIVCIYVELTFSISKKSEIFCYLNDLVYISFRKSIFLLGPRNSCSKFFRYF